MTSKKAFFGLYLFSTIIGVSMTSISPLLPRIQEEFSASKSEMGVFTAMISIGSIVGLCGLLLIADRFNRLLIFSATCVASGVFFIAMGSAGVFPVIIAEAFLYGAVIKVADSSSNALVAERAPNDLMRQTNLLRFFVSAGAVIAPLCIAPLLSAGCSWRHIERGIGLLCLSLFVLFFILWGGTKGQKTAAPKTAERRATDWLRDREIYILAILILLYTMHQIGLTNWTAVFFESLKDGGKVAGFSASFLWAGVLLGRLAVLRLSDTVALRLLLFGSLISGVLLSAAFVLRNPVFILICYVVAGLLTGAVIPTLTARVNRRFPQNAGSATTLLYLAMMMGQTIATFFMGRVADAAGIGTAMLLSSLPLVGIFIVGFIGVKTK